MRPGVELRDARPEDLPRCAWIWGEAIGDYYRNRLHQPWEPGELAPLERLLAHFLRTDPGLFLVAVDSNSDAGADLPIAFGTAHQRGSTWFLGMLFVLPAAQGAGIGRAILERLLPAQPLDQVALGLATDSAQPISNALYGRYGIVPRLPVFQLIGRPRPDAVLPDLPADVSPIPAGPASPDLDATMATLDRTLLGHVRPLDHAFLRSEGRQPFLYRSGQGDVVGYGYASPVGRVGPVAVTDPALLAPVLSHLLRAVPPAGASAIWVPGDAATVYPLLLRAGLQLEGFPALLCWTRPIADFTRYIPISLALV